MKNVNDNYINPVVSIIVPVYNVRDYLKECIDSVFQQTYKNLEIILIDDGSTDGSGELCDLFKQRDERVVIIHKQNGGQSDARNVGIQVATGKYVYFLDSDDLLAKEAICIMVNIAEKANCEVVMSTSQMFKNKVPEIQSYIYAENIVNEEEAMKRMFLHIGVGHEPWGKLYDRKLWNTVKFPVGKIYEDYAVLYKVIASCNTVAIIEAPLYFYRIRQGSTMNVPLKEKELQIFEVANSVTDFIAERVPNLKEYAEYLQLVTYLKTMKRILDGGFNQYKEEQKDIIDYVYSCRDLMHREWVKTSDKIKFWSLLLNKHIFYCVYVLGEKKNDMNIM